MALYPKNEQPLSDELFHNPTSEYRGAPFWAWNCQMTEDKITMIVDALQEMGMGGGHIHSRTGMNTTYLSREFLDLVKDAHETFKERNMITWLYDEDRWPSGAAGGLVTRDHQYRQRVLVFTPNLLGDDKERTLLAHYQVQLTGGLLDDYKRIDIDEKAAEGYDEWFAYLEVAEDDPWYNNESYVDSLNKKAVDRFIEETHETYAKEFQEEFGKTIHAIFTDEPMVRYKSRLDYAADKIDIVLPFTDDVEETFVASYGHSFMDSLPEVFWERKDGQVSVIRYWFHDHLCERFVAAFTDNVGKWCKEHNLMLTGHMMGEPELDSQTLFIGEAMRAYRSFQLPGIDMLADRRELSTAKQAQSAARQFGCPGVMSELYGVTNWDFDFRGHKLQGDWQAALGVTLRVHHLTWTSMAGEAKRDYPAPIGYQSPWYKEYKYIEDYFSRINTIMTRGKADVKIGVIHPIESYWLYWGPEEQTVAIRREMDDNFKNLIEWLLYGLLDFDFISESLLPQQNRIEEITQDGFPVGEMNYHVIVVPNCVTLRSTTLERLKAWEEKGGKLIFAGETPRYIDALPSQEVVEFVKESRHISFTKVNLLSALEEERTVKIYGERGRAAENLIYQMRTDGEDKLFFLAHVNKMKDADIPTREDLVIAIQGIYDVICYHPLDGTKERLSVSQREGKTILERTMYDHDSLLLVLKPTKEPKTVGKGMERIAEENKCCFECQGQHRIATDNAMKYKLSEPNVMVLDQAEYAFDYGKWQPREELLKIDNQFREVIGYRNRLGIPQPWLSQEEEEIRHTLSLRFRFTSEIEAEDVSLALENTTAAVILNGENIPMKITGWYTDKAIVTIRLGTIKKGVNELLVHIPYRHKENIEYMFLLGPFGVRVQGREAVITELPKNISFGDIVPQGFPFYGGNVEYQIPIELPEDGTLTVRASKFRNPLLKAAVDDGEAKRIAFSPYTVTLDCPAGKHVVKLTAFGNRVNTFGAIHNSKETENYFSPNAWRVSGDRWADEYQLRRTGVLKAPEINWVKNARERMSQL